MSRSIFLVVFFALLSVLTVAGCDDKAVKREDWNHDAIRAMEEGVGQAAEKRGQLHEAERCYKDILDRHPNDAPERAYESLHRVQKAMKDKYEN